jgi:hypothetical protein
MPFPVELLRFFEHASGGRTADPAPTPVASPPLDDDAPELDAADLPDLALTDVPAVEIPPVDIPPVDIPPVELPELSAGTDDRRARSEVPPPPGEAPGPTFLEG